MTDPRRDSNPRASFFSTAQGRIVTALGIIALVLGIVAEGFSIYNSYLQVRINRAEARIKEAQAPLAEAESRAGLSNPIPERDAKHKILCAEPEWKNTSTCQR